MLWIPFSRLVPVLNIVDLCRWVTNVCAMAMREGHCFEVGVGLYAW